MVSFATSLLPVAKRLSTLLSKYIFFFFCFLRLLHLSIYRIRAAFDDVIGHHVSYRCHRVSTARHLSAAIEALGPIRPNRQPSTLFVISLYPRVQLSNCPLPSGRTIPRLCRYKYGSFGLMSKHTSQRQR